MHSAPTMELLGRIATAMGISLVLTILMMALYQDDAPRGAAGTQVSANSMAGSR
jgi:hypothetical protein